MNAGYWVDSEISMQKTFYNDTQKAQKVQTSLPVKIGYNMIRLYERFIDALRNLQALPAQCLRESD